MGHDEYKGPERRTEYPDKRKMVLTTDDMAAIAAIMQEHHVCRYDIDPQDMKSVVEFVQGVQRNVGDYQKGVRKAVIRIAVYLTIAGVVNFIAEKMGLPSLRTLINFLGK